MALPNIETLDTDGAIREAEEAVAGDTRASFFRKAAVGGGAVLGSGVLVGMLPELAVAAKPSKKQDLAILNFALTLEYLEAAFYTEAVDKGRLDGPAQRFAKLTGSHERTHVRTLRKVINSLGGKPVAKPVFDFRGTNLTNSKFIPTAYALENEGVHAYLGQAANLKSKALLTAAATIVTVEARHAAAIAYIQGSGPLDKQGKGSITPAGAFDVPFTKKQVLKDVTGLNFIKG